MILKLHLHLAAALATALFSAGVFAETTADEAKQLGGPVLTLFGAEKAGNKEGTIPAYTGEIVKAPAGYDKKNPGNYVDPWNDKPLFTITAQNADQYADKLDAMREMFRRYPNFRMDIYPTHRTATFPKFILDNTAKNATACKTVQNELVLQGCYGGIPFPIPKTGAEVMWNHLMEYQGLFNNASWESWVVTADGTPLLQSRNRGTQWYPLFDPARTTPAIGKDIYWGVRVDTFAPARKAGEKLIILDSVDSYNIGRRAWQYIPGQRRVKLAPDLSYDTPSPYGGGVLALDESKGFLGALDRYDWKLIGKREKYILYNTYKANDPKSCPPEVMLNQKNYPNPDCLRWELHRVWVVEGKLKAGFRHIYHRRMMYWDEDGYFAGASENYDGAGKLYRNVHVFAYPYYEGTGMEGGATLHFDMQTGMYATQGLGNYPGQGFYAMPPFKNTSYFSPEALAGEGIR